jgi:hypothetical protein
MTKPCKIEAMVSVVDLEVYSEFLEAGRQIDRTVDIKSNAGWNQLVHPNPEVFETDFQRIIELMPTLFEVKAKTGLVRTFAVNPILCHR